MQSNSNRDRNCCTATQRETRAAWLFLLPSLTRWELPGSA